MKKKSGNMLNFLPILCSVVIMGILILIFVSWTKEFDKKDQIDIVARKYLLQMESYGYLSNEMEQGLSAELQSIGVKNLTYHGTTTERKQYGSFISLKIQGLLRVTSFEFTDWTTLKEKEVDIPIEINKTTTAKN